MDRTRINGYEQFREALFNRWTSSLQPLQQRINIFSHIRDISYAIVPEWQMEDDLQRMMIDENRGWCGPKHLLLSWMFERLGIRITLVSIPFRWQDQPVQYPDSIRSMFTSLPDTSHLCCQAYLDGSWKILDATWDPPLRRAGFRLMIPGTGSLRRYRL